MSATWELLAAPFAACLLVTGMLGYFGLHVVGRQVIFVDLSLAQMAALGSAVSLLFHVEPNSQWAFVASLLFAFAGAAIFAVGRFREERVPQEAIIGVVYGISSGVAILVLDRAPHGGEALKAMLVGNILFVTWRAVLLVLGVYAAVGVIHWLLRRPFTLITLDHQTARRQGLKVPWWDFLFYCTFAVVVTVSVRFAGVLLVFTYLIAPAVCAVMLTAGMNRRLALAWALGLLASGAGVYSSATFDLPTGPAVVAAFGAAVIASTAVYTIRQTLFGRREVPSG